MNNYKSLKDHVYDYISRQINNKTLKPNKKINEKKISETLNISRTPIREALIQLVNEGYLEQKPRKGFIVKEIKQESVEEVYQIIGVLEALAASLALDNFKSEDIETMKKLVEKMDIDIKYKDFKEYYDSETNFQKVYIKASRNKKLNEILESLKNFFIKKTYFDDKNNMLIEDLKEINELHKNIIKLFEEKDEKKLTHYIKNVYWNKKYSRLDSLE
jgi:DNA-binding GntR family transcriptional regulator